MSFVPHVKFVEGETYILLRHVKVSGGYLTPNTSCEYFGGYSSGGSETFLFRVDKKTYEIESEDVFPFDGPLFAELN